jgi:hypothetical protein
VTTKRDDFAVTANRFVLVFVAMMAQVTLHQPRFSVVGIDVENSIEEDLGYLPTLLRNSARGMPSIYRNYPHVPSRVAVDLRVGNS